MIGRMDCSLDDALRPKDLVMPAAVSLHPHSTILETPAPTPPISRTLDEANRMNGLLHGGTHLRLAVLVLAGAQRVRHALVRVHKGAGKVVGGVALRGDAERRSSQMQVRQNNITRLPSILNAPYDCLTPHPLRSTRPASSVSRAPVVLGLLCHICYRLYNSISPEPTHLIRVLRAPVVCEVAAECHRVAQRLVGRAHVQLDAHAVLQACRTLTQGWTELRQGSAPKQLRSCSA